MKTRHDSIITTRPLLVSFGARLDAGARPGRGSVSLRGRARHGAAAHRSITNNTAARCQRAATQSKNWEKITEHTLFEDSISFFKLLFGDFNRISIFKKIIL